MNVSDPHLDDLRDIRQLMQRSSRFISLSGLSGIAAGACALVAAALAHNWLSPYRTESGTDYGALNQGALLRSGSVARDLLWLGLGTFVVAFVLAFLFTWLRSRKTGVPIWGLTARRVIWHVALPMLVGGLFIWRLLEFGHAGFVAPACLLFYGLALVNAAKFTLPEIRVLGYCQLLLGAANLWLMGYGLYFWAIGFGVLHILYGIIMWNKYERQPQAA